MVCGGCGSMWQCLLNGADVVARRAGECSAVMCCRSMGCCGLVRMMLNVARQ